MTALNDRKLITVSAESRALIRAAIRRHPDWTAYRTERDLDLSEMTTREAIFDACDALHIDVAATIAAGPQEPEETPRAPRAARVAARLFDEAHEAPTAVAAPAKNMGALTTREMEAVRAQITAPIAAPAAPVTPAPADAAAQLLGLIAGLAPKATLDEARVVTIAREQALEIAYTAHDALSLELKRLIAETVANGPAIRIELRRGEEITPVEGHHHPQFARLLRALAARQGDGFAPNIWLSGPAGSGKTHAAKIAAKALGVAWHYNGALSMPHELLGFIDAAGHYHRTPFREAYEHGGLYLFDEVDGSDNSALLALNAALANGTATFPDGKISRHADCYIVATANTWGLGATADYVGRSKIDAAFLSRFPVRLAWDYDEKLEQQICGNPAFAKRVQAARAKARAAGLKVLIDPRASIAGAALIAQGFTSDEASEMTYQANLSAEQRRMIGA